MELKIKRLTIYVLLVSTLFVNFITTGCKKPMTTLEDLIDLRNLSINHVEEKYFIPKEQREYPVSYEKMTNLTRVTNSKIPAYFYFENESVKMIYINDAKLLSKINHSKVTSTYGEAYFLRSRAGKTSSMYVYPKQGFAYSMDKNKIHFLEIFQPTTFDDYKNSIYKDPGNFIR